ncbi:tRNA dihydrouridine synthase DusB [Candidatus Cyanaurora vandensis]|uniref:tRNA dihydrouridine synthase DusB n=1 Tax=Candidatus Cyanaurora vandensis TaxID=2714958 RepID=UPI00257DF247|nr:tRNA dihydrouridine synthase DusB [Candidatus Cyanaurora vandensis]
MMAQPLQVGSVTLHSRVFQSPLAGVTDRVFRQLVRRFAPDSLSYTEMVSATGLHYAKELPYVMDVGQGETPIGIQLFDCRPDFLVEAAVLAQREGAQIIDINMGCPVNKITKNGGGSSLLKDPRLAGEIVARVAEAVSVPVTVKTRIGWSDQDINILDFAQRMADSGAQLITVHARTRAQGFDGPARWEWIARVKAKLTIPVIANGDIFSIAAAQQCLALTGADGVMCSRGTMGNPGLVGQIDHFFKTGEQLPDPSPAQRLRLAREHIQLLHGYKGQRGLQQSRKHATWYVKSVPGAGLLRGQLARLESVAQAEDLIEQALQTLPPDL